MVYHKVLVPFPKLHLSRCSFLLFLMFSFTNSSVAIPILGDLMGICPLGCRFEQLSGYIFKAFFDLRAYCGGFGFFKIFLYFVDLYKT